MKWVGGNQKMRFVLTMLSMAMVYRHPLISRGCCSGCDIRLRRTTLGESLSSVGRGLGTRKKALDVTDIKGFQTADYRRGWLLRFRDNQS